MRYRTVLLVLAVLLLPAEPVWAHWCSNIFKTHAKLLVKPEKTTINLSGSTQLKVYLQNNFPYSLKVEMRGNASSYSTSVSPSSQTVHAGQQVLFTFTISGGSGSVQVSQLQIQAKIREGGWQSSSGNLVNQNPSQSTLVSASVYGSSTGSQSASLNAAVLADRYPSAQISSMLGRTGVEQLIHWFGYRFCYNSGGTYRCGSQACPSPCSEGSSWTSTAQFPQNCMRAGVEVGIRKAKLGSKLSSARAGAINAMKAGGGEHKCLAAVVGGLLWQGASSSSSFESALNQVSSTCKAAGLRALGKGSPSSCSSGQSYERAACAAAEGLQNNDAPVKNVLLQNAGNTSYSALYASYMLYLVAKDRLSKGKVPSFYPSVGPSPDSGSSPPPKKDSGGSGSSPELGPGADGQIGLDSPSSPSSEGIPNSGASERENELLGSCALTPGTPALPPYLLLLLALIALRRIRP